MKHWIRATALLLPLMLAACLFQPGKFESAMTIHKDRSFTFTYKGEVMAVDLGGMTGDMAKAMSTVDDSTTEKADDAATMPEDMAELEQETPEQKAAKKAEKDADYRELATQLSKEYGYKTVEYRGDGMFYVDYAISGTLTHGFTFPFNQDTAMVFPWVTVELRGGDTVRVKAPGFAKADMGGLGGALDAAGGEPPSKMDGTFTLTTDAVLVSQNEENGAKTVGGNSVVSWRINSRTEAAPMAVLRLNAR